MARNEKPSVHVLPAPCAGHDPTSLRQNDSATEADLCDEFWKTSAVPSFESVINLPASPETSWSFVVERGAEIEPFVFEPQGVQGVGTLKELTFRVLGMPIRGTSRTLAWEPPSRCEFESVKPSWPVRTSIGETFERSEAGTRHVIRYDVHPTGRVGTVAAPLVCRLMKRSRRRYQQRLRAALLTLTADPIRGDRDP